MRMRNQVRESDEKAVVPRQPLSEPAAEANQERHRGMGMLASLSQAALVALLVVDVSFSLKLVVLYLDGGWELIRGWIGHISGDETAATAQISIASFGLVCVGLAAVTIGLWRLQIFLQRRVRRQNTSPAPRMA